MFQLIPVFLGLFDSTVQKLMNGFRDIFYELAYSNLSNMLSDLNEKVGTISTELSTAPDAWQGGTIWSLIVKKLKKQRFTSNLHQLMQKSVQTRKNRIISAMSGQFQSGLPIFKTNKNTYWNLQEEYIWLEEFIM